MTHALLLLLLMQAPAEAKLVVRWSTPHDLKALAQAPSACGDQKDVRQPFTALLAIRGTGRVETRTLSLDDRAGTLTFENVPPGEHMLHVTAGALPAVVHSVEAGERDIELRWPIISGNVTKNGKPVHARVFRTAITDPRTGRYTAAIAPRTMFTVEPCDGSMTYWAVPEAPPSEGAAYDIELPSNRVDVELADAATGQPVKDAVISFMAPLDETSNAMHFSMTGPRSDQRGRARLETLVPGRPLMVCARHDDYEHACSERFQLRGDEAKTLHIPVTKLIKRAGRVIAPATGLAMVSWHGRDGVRETVRTDSQGRFTSTKPHAAGEIVTVSSEHFFYAFVQPELKDGQPFEIRVPAARARTFEVHLSKSAANESAMFAIAIGDLAIPREALAQHLLRDGQEPMLARGSSRIVRNVLETAPLFVSFEGRPRRPLGEQSIVIFD